MLIGETEDTPALTVQMPGSALQGTPMTTGSQFVAITLHRIPRKAVCGVVILAQQEDESWAGKCSKCGGDFRLDRDTKFEAQVRAMRN
jgi:hypothetical protein